MSYQVGDSCYATVADAGVAACALYVPQSHLTNNGTAVHTLSCSGVDASGALLLQVLSARVNGGSVVSNTVAISPQYPECIQQQKVDASLSLFGAVLGLVALAYAAWQVKAWLDRGARNQE